MRMFDGNFYEHATRLSRAKLREHFNAARQKGQRYVVVIEERLAAHSMILSRENAVAVIDEDAIIRALRSKGLRPDAPHTYLKRVFDTQGNFKDQFKASQDAPADSALSPAARTAYQRYLGQMHDSHQRRNAPPKGFWGSLFG